MNNTPTSTRFIIYVTQPDGSVKFFKAFRVMDGVPVCTTNKKQAKKFDYEYEAQGMIDDIVGALYNMYVCVLPCWYDMCA